MKLTAIAESIRRLPMPERAAQPVFRHFRRRDELHVFISNGELVLATNRALAITHAISLGIMTRAVFECHEKRRFFEAGYVMKVGGAAFTFSERFNKLDRDTLLKADEAARKAFEKFRKERNA